MTQAESNIFTDEQLQRNMDYYRAQSIAMAMLDAGLIDRDQFVLLTDLNLESFSPSSYRCAYIPRTLAANQAFDAGKWRVRVYSSSSDCQQAAILKQSIIRFLKTLSRL